jgi:hypothetical protein
MREQDVKMFEALRKSELGKQLAEYIEHLQADICDVRNWTDKDTPESARQASRALDVLRKNLVTSIGTGKSTPNDYV